MDLKFVSGSIATVIAVAGFFPYLRDTFSLKTKPHAYTWLIWFLTQGAAVVGTWYGGGGWGALNITVGAGLVFIVFLFSLKFGTKNITKSDTVTLIAALCAILVWWQLKQPVLSVLMVSAIDTIGYIPSFRKCYGDPWSETLSTWFVFSLSNVFAILALREYNLLTATYLSMMTIANTSLLVFCMIRRKSVPQPQEPQKAQEPQVNQQPS